MQQACEEAAVENDKENDTKSVRQRTPDQVQKTDWALQCWKWKWKGNFEKQSEIVDGVSKLWE